jgi:hypothetical protein
MSVVVNEGGSAVNVGLKSDVNVETVNLSGGTFTSVAGDNITYYNVTQNIKESDGERMPRLSIPYFIT